MENSPDQRAIADRQGAHRPHQKPACSWDFRCRHGEVPISTVSVAAIPIRSELPAKWVQAPSVPECPALSSGLQRPPFSFVAYLGGTAGTSTELWMALIPYRP